MTGIKMIANRGVGVLLSIVMVLTSVTVALPTAYAAEEEETAADAGTVTITCNGKETSSVSVPQDDKVTLTATTSVSSSELQWEILAEAADNEDDEVWATIYGETDEDLTVNYALVSGLMDSSGSVYLRCTATNDGGEAVSSRVKAKVSFIYSESTLEQKAKANADEDDTDTDSNNSGDSQIVTLTVNYLDKNGSKVYSPYTAQYTAGTSGITTTLTSPAYAGYTPICTWSGDVSTYDGTYEAAYEAYEANADSVAASTLKINDLTINKDIVINVYYTPILVNYTVEYYFQNVNDDEYTKDENLDTVGKALTGDTISNEDIDAGLANKKDSNGDNDGEGFTALYHIPTEAAGDGSTIISSYYDRNYYLYTFNLDGGHGTEPIYARYGSSFKVNQPTKAGYNFKRWTLESATDSNGNSIDISTITDSELTCGETYTMPFQNRVYKAVWESLNADVTVVYWREQVDNTNQQGGVKHTVTNEDGEEETLTFEYWGSREGVSAKSGTTLDIGTTFENGTDDDGNTVYSQITDTSDIGTDATGSKVGCATSITEAMQKESNTDYQNRVNTTSYWKRFDLADYDKNVLVQGDGSTVINVYYTRRTYTLRIVYARSIECTQSIINALKSGGDYDEEHGVKLGEQLYYVYGDNAYYFGTYGSSPAKCTDQDGDNDVDDDDYLIYNLKNSSNINTEVRKGTSTWGLLTEEPTLRDEYKDKFTTGKITFYGNNSYFNGSAGSAENTPWTYYYLEIKTKYGYDISDKFTGSLFNPVKLNKISRSTKKNDETYNYAYYASVNGEYYVRYAQDNSGNQTIKGTYTRLDDDLLFNMMGKDGSTSDTGIASEDFTTVSFLAAWENGSGNITWNMPCEWVYKYYVQSVNNETTSKVLTTSNSTSKDTINLVEEELFTSYRIGDNHSNTGKVYNGGTWNEKPTAIEGFTFVANAGYNYKDSYRLVDPDTGTADMTTWLDDGTLKTITKYTVTSSDGDTTTYDTLDSYTVEFYYVRNSYKLEFYNYSGFVSEDYLNNAFNDATVGTDDGIPYISVQYEAELLDYEFTPDYPSTLESGAYEFKGWYTSPTFEEETKVDFSTFTMPASDLKLYAKWSAVENSARVFDSYSSMQAFQTQAIVSENSDLYAALQEIEHSVVYEVDSGWLAAIDAAYYLLENSTATGDEAVTVTSSTKVEVTYEGETRYYVREGGQYYRVNDPYDNSDNSSRYHNSLFSYNGKKYVYVINDNGRTGYVEADGLIDVYHRMHGNVIGSLTTPTDPTNNGRVFSGWKYVNSSGTQTAFSPQDSPLNANIDLYADWSSKTNVPYVIHHATYNALSESTDATAIAALKDSVSKLENNVTAEYNGTTYVYLTEDNGWHQLIADDDTGYRFDGTTHTFSPKSAAYRYESFKDNYYPTVSSHSVQMTTTTDAIDNSYTFLYVNVTNISYKVRYLNEATGEAVANEVTRKNDSGYSIVTEKYVAVENYLPNASYKTLTLVAKQNDDGTWSGDDEANVITFYYTYSASSTTYVVHYMMQNLGTGTTRDDNYTENTDQRVTGSATVGETVTIDPQSFVGFEMSNTAVNKFTDSETDESKNLPGTADDDGNTVFTFTAADSGNDIYIYYNRNNYEYTVYYLKSGTDVTKITDTDYVSTGCKSITGNGQYGATVTATAHDFSSLGYMYQTYSLSLTLSTANNNIYFFYTPLQYTVEFVIVGDEAGATLSSTQQTITTKTDVSFNSSTITVKDGYTFGGWFYDEACENAVKTESEKDETDKAYVSGDNNETITPITANIPANNTNGNATTKFYAKITSIKKTVVFKPNGGRINGSTDNYSVTSSWLANGLPSLVTAYRDGYTFDCWYYTDSSGNEVKVDDDTTFKTIAEETVPGASATSSEVTITLTAAWKEATVVFHKNYSTYDITVADDTDDVFRTYYFSTSTTESTYKVGEDGKITQFEDIPTDHVNNDWIFAGWYYSAEGSNKALSWSSDTFTGDTDLYAHWIKNGTVAQEDDGKVISNSSDSSATTYKEFGMVGVQIRNATGDTNYPNKESDDSAYSTDGLRFITSVSENLLTELKALNGAIPQYGYVATTSSALIEVLTGTKYKITSGTKELTKDDITYTLADGTSEKTKIKSAVTRDLTSQVGTTKGVTTKNSTNSSYSITSDHYNGTNYRLYSFVITYSNDDDKSKDVCIRSYIDYTDANGVRRTYYNDYTNNSNEVANCKACVTTYNDVKKLVSTYTNTTSGDVTEETATEATSTDDSTDGSGETTTSN